MLIYVGYLLSIVSLVCYIYVVVQMFKHGKTTPGIISLVGIIVCGLGVLYAFIYGWTKAKEWNITNVMIAWSVAIVLNIGISVMTFPEQMRQAQLQQQNMNFGAPVVPVVPK